VNDLVRGPVGYLLAWSACRVLSRSAVVHHDGPVSVAGAFTLAEAGRLADNAGLSGVRLTRHWPQRFLLSWSC
jgi:thiazole synthase ThiGH ThiG subunit